jgi:toxin ParE1/3/4
MSRYRLTDEARQDLDEVWFYIAEDNPPAADRLLDTLYEKFLLLAGQPLLGRARPELGVNLRSLPVGNYVIFYRPIDDGIEVALVLHGTRDIEGVFEGYLVG